MMHHLDPAKDFHRASRALVKELTRLAPWDAWVVSRQRRDGQFSVLQVTDNPWGLDIGPIGPWEEMLCANMAQGAPTLASDITHVPAYADNERARAVGVTAYVGVPVLTASGGIFGSICAVNQKVAHLDESTLGTLRMGAKMLGTILQLEQQMTGLSRTTAEEDGHVDRDPLTGMLNRRGLKRAADRAECHARTFGNRPAIVSVNLDGLARINDDHGHAGGDAAIREASTVLRQVIGESGVGARVGGDEFLVLLDDVAEPDLVTLSRRLEDAVARMGRSASIGVAISSGDDPIGAVIGRADTSMYAQRRQSAVRVADTEVADDVHGWLRRAVGEVPSSPNRSIQVLLDRAREYLSLDVLFVGRWKDGQRTFEYVSADEPTKAGLQGTSQPLEETYCLPIVQGTVPRAIPNAQAEPSVADIPMTADLGIGAHVGAPLHLADGTFYGTICGASFTPDETINERDGAFLEFLTEVIGNDLAEMTAKDEATRTMMEGLRGMMTSGQPAIVVQPIVDLVSGRTVGFEALSRFEDVSVTPDVWFSRAAEVDMAVEFEVHAVRRALTLLPMLPADTYLSVNVSPSVASSRALLAVLDGVDTARVVVELTEQLPLGFTHDGDWLPRLRRTGVRIAVDDAGAGHSGMQRILETSPDVIKIDRSIVTRCQADPARQAMIKALLDFSGAIGADLVAEGIEEQVEIETLTRLGVRAGQGFRLGRPASLSLYLAELV